MFLDLHNFVSDISEDGDLAHLQIEKAVLAEKSLTSIHLKWGGKKFLAANFILACVLLSIQSKGVLAQRQNKTQPQTPCICLTFNGLCILVKVYYTWKCHQTVSAIC